MKIKLGPKTITINSIRFPKYIPGLRLIGPFRVPTPWKAFKIGGSRAAFGMLAFVAVGFGLTIFITHATTSTEIGWPKPGAATRSRTRSARRWNRTLKHRSNRRKH